MKTPRYYWSRLRFRVRQLVCIIRGHDAPNGGECYYCGMIVDDKWLDGYDDL